MNLLKKILLVLLAFNFVISPVQATKTKQVMECYKLLNVGEKVWGTYVCNSCDSETSSMPRANGRQACYHCGHPHTNEQYQPPHHIKRNHQTYVLVNAPVEVRNGSEGPVWSCPFCSSSNFINVSRCEGCGAEGDIGNIKNNDAGRVVRQSEGGARPTEFRQEGNIAVPQRERPTRTPIAIRPDGQSEKSFLQSIPGPLKAVVATAVAAGAIGFMWWSVQTHSHMGVVTHVNQTNIEVEYKDGETMQKLNMQANPQDTTPWRVGETVEVHFRNISGATGGERSNGELLEAPR